MRPIGYFLLLFSFISANVIHTMYLPEQREQALRRAFQLYADQAQFYASQFHADQLHASQLWTQAHDASQLYAHHAQHCAQAQYHAQPQFIPSAVDSCFIPSHCYQPWPSAPTNFSASTNLSNPSKLYNLQSQKKRNNPCPDNFRTASRDQVTQPVNRKLRKIKKESESPKNTATMLLALKNSTSLNTTRELPSPKNTDHSTDCKFTFECPSCDQKFSSNLKTAIKRNLTKHNASRKHRLTEQEIEDCMDNLNGSKNPKFFKVPCPYYTSSCQYIAYAKKKNELENALSNHLRWKHTKDLKKEKKCVKFQNFAKYFEEFGKTLLTSNPNFVPNPNKKRKLPH